MRLLLATRAVLIVTAAVALSAADRAEAKGSFATLSGGDLPHAIHVPFSATRWVPGSGDPFEAYSPPQPVSAPAVLGEAYTVWTEYVAQEMYRRGLAPDGWEIRYYPEQGVVAVPVIGREHWYALDLAANEILARYVTLGREGLLPEQPWRIHVEIAEGILEGRAVPFEAEISPYGRSSEHGSIDAEAFWKLLLGMNASYREVHPSEFREGAIQFWPESAGRNTAWPKRALHDLEIHLRYPDGDEHTLTYLVDHDLLVHDARAGWPWWWGWKLDEELARFLRLYLPDVEEPSDVAVLASNQSSRPGDEQPRTITLPSDKSSASTLLLLLAVGASLVGIADIVRAVLREDHR